MREKKIAIFVDGSNLAAASRAAGYMLDYDKVYKYFDDTGAVVDASYFTALPPKEVMTKLRTLTDRLQYHGWNVVTKETKDMFADDGILSTKGNMDVEIAVKAMKLANKISDLVLFSGDGDFVSLVQALQEETVRVTVVSYLPKRFDENCQVADELRKQANAFINLRDMRQHWILERKV